MLNAEQQKAFEERGFLRLPGFLDDDLLHRLQATFDRLLAVDAAPGKVIVPAAEGEVVTNVDMLCGRDDLTCLELLGNPATLALARQICGDDFFLIQEFAVIKHRGDDMSVLWHKDMVHRRSGLCFTMGIYLDDAEPGDGALEVVEASHLSERDICSLMQDPAIAVPMRAGDVLIHDMMLAHASPPLTSRALRRVIFFEFLSAAHVARETIYTAEAVSRRTRLIHAAARHWANCAPDREAFALPLPNPAPDDEARPLREVISEIYALPVPARPSSYCINGTAVFDRFD